MSFNTVCLSFDIIPEDCTVVIFQGTFNFLLKVPLLLGHRLLVEKYCLKYNALCAYSSVRINILSSCVLKLLRTMAVLQHYCPKQVGEPELEVPHVRRSGFYF